LSLPLSSGYGDNSSNASRSNGGHGGGDSTNDRRDSSYRGGAGGENRDFGTGLEQRYR
jgi:hypothetical protein